VIDLPELLVPDAAAWREWLSEQHTSCPGVWLVLTRKGGMLTEITYATALQEALCFGWIDGQGRARDEQSSLQRMTPRGPRSRWSSRNVGLVGELEAAGRMEPAGRAAVEAAKADGRWEAAYAPPSEAVAPDDLLAAIAAVPEAQAMYDVLTKTNRYVLTYQLTTVKRAETRARKIERFVAMLARQETPYPQKARPD